jgi:hypothetical protein
MPGRTKAWCAGNENLSFLSQMDALKSKVGGAFGALGWRGEAPNRVFFPPVE